MDSLTQIVLGAACGEVVAGKKLGNRAMLWGALGGTIPDFDVFANFFTDEITATAFHRGFMHSFLFAALAPWLLAWIARRFYANEVHQRKGYKVGFALFWIIFYALAATGINFIPILLKLGFKWWIFLPTLALGGWLVYKLWFDYRKRALSDGQASYLTWVQLFFWSIFTHPILDCFTNWGTQIWQPFADTRIQWNTVSVVDPIYTVPFGLLLIAAAFLPKSSRTRFALAWAGMLWGMGYLAFTYWHKQTVDRAIEDGLKAKNIPYQRFQSNPTIFNNIVWAGVAEGDTAYYTGLYGFKDRNPRFNKISTVPKNYQLIGHVPTDDRTMKFIRWFTDGYYNVIPYNGDTLQINDLRFGLLGDTLTGDNYVFPFLLFKNGKGEWDLKQHNPAEDDVEMNKKSMAELFDRVLHGK